MPIGKQEINASSMPCPPSKELSHVSTGEGTAITQPVIVSKYIPHTSSNNNAFIAKTLDSRRVSPMAITVDHIRKMQQDTADALTQLNRNYIGLMLMHSGSNGTFNGLHSVPGILFQPDSGNLIEVNSNVSNLPPRAQETFRHMDHMFCQQSSHAVNILCQQLAENQQQLAHNINQLSTWEAGQQIPQSLLQETLLSNYIMPPQAISLNNFPGVFQDTAHPQHPQHLQPWLPSGYQLLNGGNSIGGFHCAQSHWSPGSALPPIWPQQPGFYFMPQQPHPGDVFHNPVHPYPLWNEWKNSNNQQDPLCLYPSIPPNQNIGLKQKHVEPAVGNTSFENNALPSLTSNKKEHQIQSEGVQTKAREQADTEQIEALTNQLKSRDSENKYLNMKLEQAHNKEQALQESAAGQKAKLEQKIVDGNQEYLKVCEELDHLTAIFKNFDESNPEISKLQHALQYAKDDIHNLNAEKKKTTKTLQSKQEELDRLGSDIKKKNNEISMLNENIAILTSTKGENTQDNSMQINILSKKLEESNNECMELKYKLDENKVNFNKMQLVFEEENEKLRNECVELRSNVDKLTKQQDSHVSISTNIELNQKIKDLNKDVENLRDRLSATAGDKLRNNNPNIADLSDMNRPTSLADKFNSLYTDEYTDYLEVLEDQMGEREGIKTMCKIMMEAYNYALKFHDETIKDIASSLNLNDEDMDDCHIQEAIIKILKNNNTLEKHIELIKNKLLDKFNNLPCEIIKNKDFRDLYISKCVKLAHHMAITRPPLFLVADDDQGSRIDKTKENMFTRNGNTLEYRVWPRLLLYKDGPMLAKGVCQPYPIK